MLPEYIGGLRGWTVKGMRWRPKATATDAIPNGSLHLVQFAGHTGTNLELSSGRTDLQATLSAHCAGAGSYFLT